MEMYVDVGGRGWKLKDWPWCELLGGGGGAVMVVVVVGLGGGVIFHSLGGTLVLSNTDTHSTLTDRQTEDRGTE